MKNLTLFFFLLLTPFFSYTQDIDIPDALFLEALIDLGVDTSGDGIIQVSEAESLEKLTLENPDITNLEGIHFFVNLRELDFWGTSVTSINNATLIKLEKIRTAQNIESIVVTDHPLLTSLSCASALMEVLDLSQNPLLDSLEVPLCPFLTSLDLSLNPRLKFIEAWNSYNIRSINLSNNPELIYLGLNTAQLEKLDISKCTKLEYLDCSFSPIPILDISSNPLMKDLIAFECPVQILNLANGSILENFDYSYSSGISPLTQVCIDSDEEDWLNSLIDTQDIIVSTICNHSDGIGYSKISGNIGFDNNGNCSYDDAIFPNVQFRIESDQGTSFSSTSGQVGVYDIYLLASTGVEYTVTPIVYNSEIFSISPNQMTVTFDPSNPAMLQDFCISPRAPLISDVRITMVPIDIARPGFDASYKVILENQGNTSSSGSMLITYPEETTSYISSGSTWTDNDGFLVGDYTDLLPFQKREYILDFSLNSPMDTPALNDGDILKYSASVFPDLQDHHSPSNAFELCQEVVNSFDPNDKTCLNGPYINIDSLENNAVVYKIRFENTGTADAVNITVKDNLDPYTFDISTIRILDASHAVQLQTRSNVVDFIFENINLPWQDDLNDGYVVFEVMINSDIMVSDSILNSADIFFDFNFPIVTNTATSEVVIDADNDGFNNLDDCDDTDPNINPDAPEIDSNGIDDNCDGVTSLQETNFTQLTIKPNPAEHSITVSSETIAERIVILNNTGKIIQVKTPKGIYTDIDVSQLPKGVYFIKVHFGSSQKESIRKLVKM